MLRMYQTPEWVVMQVNSVDAPAADYHARKIENKNI